jgi:hypothetical protein
METPTPALASGAIAPHFTLPDLLGCPHRMQDARGRIVLLNFWSAECPWSARADEALKPLLLGWSQEVILLTIACNANETLDLIQHVAAERQLPLVLVDQNQQVADLFGAQTTPHLFVIDGSSVLRYQGALDDVTFRQRTPSKLYLRDAVEAVRSGRAPDPAQTPPYGCMIVHYRA